MKNVKIKRITRETRMYAPKVEKAYNIMKKRIKKEELEPVKQMMSGIEKLDNYFFLTAENEGRIMGACTGAALSCRLFSIIFGHYTVVEEKECRKGIGSILREARESAAEGYLNSRGLPGLKYHFMELSKPEQGEDMGKLWALRKKGFGIVMTPDGKNIFRYVTPDLDGGKNHMPMMTAISRILKTVHEVPKKDYIEILDAVYENYKKHYPGNSGDIECMKRTFIMRLINSEGEQLPLVSEPAVILNREQK